MAHKFESGNWEHVSNWKAKSFICWNCGKQIASEKAFYSQTVGPTKYHSFIFICPNCNAPLINDDGGKEILLSLPGKEIKKLPENVKSIYLEIRKSLQAGCFNGAVMLMRKLIMHIAIEEGAEQGKRFIEYVDYLYENGNIPKKSKNKSDSVRTLGNDTNHKIENRTEGEALKCFELVELLLRVNYEFADEGEKDGS